MRVGWTSSQKVVVTRTSKQKQGLVDYFPVFQTKERRGSGSREEDPESELPGSTRVTPATSVRLRWCPRVRPTVKDQVRGRKRSRHTHTRQGEADGRTRRKVRVCRPSHLVSQEPSVKLWWWTRLLMIRTRNGLSEKQVIRKFHKCPGVLLSLEIMGNLVVIRPFSTTFHLFVGTPNS